MRRSRFSLRSILAAAGISLSPGRVPGRPSTERALPGDHDVQDAIGERVLQGVAVRVRGEVDLREILPVPFSLKDKLSLVESDADFVPRDAGHLRGQENRGFGENDVDERIPRLDLLAFERGPRGFEARLPRARREAVDERLAEHAELPFERILQHAV